MTEPNSGKLVARRAFSNPLLSILRAFCFIIITPIDLFTYLAQSIGKDEHEARRHALNATTTWAKHCLSLLGIQVKAEGEIPDGPVLYCSNHSGYVDIFAIASVCNTFYIAKGALNSWPIVGTLYKKSRHMSIARQQKSAVIKANEQIVDRLQDGYSVTLFLEGTSSGNNKILPFHASLIQSGIDANVNLVPIGIRWITINQKIDISEDVAYWKDHVFPFHIFRLFGLSGVQAIVKFGQPKQCGTQSRKELSDALRNEIGQLTGLPT